MTQKIRYDVFESRDGAAWIVWDRQTHARANEIRFRLEREAQVVVDAMNAALDPVQLKALVPAPSRELIYAELAGAR